MYYDVVQYVSKVCQLSQCSRETISVVVMIPYCYRKLQPFLIIVSRLHLIVDNVRPANAKHYLRPIYRCLAEPLLWTEPLSRYTWAS